MCDAGTACIFRQSWFVDVWLLEKELGVKIYQHPIQRELNEKGFIGHGDGLGRVTFTVINSLKKFFQSYLSIYVSLAYPDIGVRIANYFSQKQIWHGGWKKYWKPLKVKRMNGLFSFLKNTSKRAFRLLCLWSSPFTAWYLFKWKTNTSIPVTGLIITTMQFWWGLPELKYYKPWKTIYLFSGWLFKTKRIVFILLWLPALLPFCVCHVLYSHQHVKTKANLVAVDNFGSFIRPLTMV